ncbi:hypothetical protein ACFQ45_13110 [Rhodanobacter aciditrophus]|uniref:Uncharacterized protein n=1 Tax=Rhodanobacter aciditrophus TaxID=1623218 RepID=A0ABW4B4Y6_9GAMM
MASKAEVIGEIVCECGRCAYVEQTKRKGDFLQVRCSACGVDQRTGKTIQTRWKSTMKPVGHYHDSKTVAPYGAETVEPVAETKTDTIGNSTDTLKVTLPEPAAKPAITRRETIKPRTQTNGTSTLLGLGVFVVFAGVSVLGSELLKATKG